MPAGRPSEYTQEIADRFCAEVSAGASMRTICNAEDMPDRVTIFRWLRTFDQFRSQYDKAAQERSEALIEDMQDIADDGSNDWMEKRNEKGEVIGWQVNGEHIQRSRLRVDTRKWIASKLKPKKYGDKLDVNQTGNVTLQIVTGVDPQDGNDSGNPAG